ncbi:MAG: type I-C CRISPR-associated protein Cas5c [Hominenteromicrobium sp.]
MSVQVEIWGDFACFCRPEMKVERVSYDVMTPSAARGILEAVFWHPGLKWHIDRIRVLAPIRFANIRRNEVDAVASCKKIKSAMEKGSALYIATPQAIQQRAAMVLTNVRYVIEAHFTMTDRAAPGDNPGKFQEMMRRRLDRGACFHTPSLGMREFPAYFRAWNGEGTVPEELRGRRELGWMLYDFDYSDPADVRPMFFRAVLEDGVLELGDCEVVR